jgi:hypothetical protein
MTFAQRAARFAAICTFLTALAVASVCATGKAWAQPHGGISAVNPRKQRPPKHRPPRQPVLPLSSAAGRSRRSTHRPRSGR